MSSFTKLPDPVMYQVDNSYEFVICTEIFLEGMQRQITLRGIRYSYEESDLVNLGLCEVVLDVNENIVMKLDKDGKYID